MIDPVGYAIASGIPDILGKDTPIIEEIQRIEGEMRRTGIAVHSVVQTEVIYDRILQSVSDARADLLILGTHAATDAGRAAIGAVARQILARTPLPSAYRTARERTPYSSRRLAACTHCY